MADGEAGTEVFPEAVNGDEAPEEVMRKCGLKLGMQRDAICEGTLSCEEKLGVYTTICEGRCTAE